MILLKHDSHTHTGFSSDSVTPMAAMIEQAIANGLESICITDHMDYDFPKKYKHSFVFDISKYMESLRVLTHQYQDKILVRKGVEVGLKNSAIAPIRTLVQEHSFDYVIGSIHLVHDMDMYYQEYWESYASEQAAIKAYFDTTLEMLPLALGSVDALGHLDYVVRYTPSHNPSYGYKDYQSVLDAILELLIKNNIALELNSSGYKAGTAMPNPCYEVLKRYLALGGELVSVGSDGHSPEFLSFHFNDLYELMKKAGLKSYVIYKDRKPVTIPLI